MVAPTPAGSYRVRAISQAEQFCRQRRCKSWPGVSKNAPPGAIAVDGASGFHVTTGTLCQNAVDSEFSMACWRDIVLLLAIDWLTGLSCIVSSHRALCARH